jgi:uncharacterized tellurite resistance protein B-like protein
MPHLIAIDTSDSDAEMRSMEMTVLLHVACGIIVVNRTQLTALVELVFQRVNLHSSIYKAAVKLGRGPEKQFTVALHSLLWNMALSTEFT